MHYNNWYCNQCDDAILLVIVSGILFSQHFKIEVLAGDTATVCVGRCVDW